MKRQILSIVSLRFFIAATVLTASSVAGAAPPFHAKNPVLALDSIADEQPHVSYLGSDEEYYYFRIQFINSDGSRNEITLRDKSNGTVLYSDNFTSPIFLKRIAVPKDITFLQWELEKKSGKGRPYKSYQSFTTEVKKREEVYVTRL